MNMMLSQLDQHKLLFTQVAVQIVAWHYIFEYTEWYLRTYCTTQKWFIQWSKKPFLGERELGSERLIAQMGHYLQAVGGGFLIALGYYFNAPQLFIAGALSEFSYELLDTCKLIKERYITKKGNASAENMPFKMFMMAIIHHSGASTVILPACMYYAENEHVLRAGFGLLGFAAVMIPFGAIQKSRDVYNLKERGQFTVCYVISTVFFMYFRGVLVLQGMYGFIRDEFPSLSLQLKVMFCVYMVLINLLNVSLVLAFSHGLYKFLFTSAATKKPTKITKASLMRSPSIPFELIRMQSTPLM